MIRLFKVSIPSTVIALVLTETILVFGCYLAAAFLTLDVPAGILLVDDRYLLRIGIVVALIVLGFYFHDLYEDFRVRSRLLLIQQTCVVLGTSFCLQAVLSYGRSTLLLPKLMMALGSTLVLVALPTWRILFARFVYKALGTQRILFLGSGPVIQEILARVTDRPDLGLAPLGYLEDGYTKAAFLQPAGMARMAAALSSSDASGATAVADAGVAEMIAPDISNVPCLGSFEDLDQVVEEQRPDRIVVGVAERRNRLPLEQLLRWRFAGIHIEEAALTFEKVFHRVPTRNLRPSQLIFSSELGPSRVSAALHDAYSWILGLIILILASPVMVLVAILVRATSSGPALYRQTRVGLNGKTFQVFKFRSMSQNAEARTGAVWAKRNDPRITPLGRWLRLSRLDELPQLFNVIRGEMALIGPRPERPEFVEVLKQQIPYYGQRHCVKPGITGWAQINHKYGDTVEDSLIKLEFDLYYIKNLAVSLDSYIMFHTIKTMLLAKGAQ
jgi:sugar transferase (PEP-CTERM system associated)